MSIFFYFLFYLLSMQLLEIQQQSPEKAITIRVSTLPAYADCPRRAAAKSWRYMIENDGFNLRKLPNTIGAAIGSGVHAGAAYILVSKRDGADAQIKDAQELSIIELRKQTAAGSLWDNTTSNQNTAERQTLRLTTQVNSDLAPTINPELVENRRKAVIAPGWELSGQSDTETTDAVIRDWKTGAVLRQYQAQHGGYSLLRRSQGGTRPSRLIMDHLKRVAIDRPQPPVMSVEYDISMAERAAWGTIKHIMRDIRAFLKSGDPWCFACNPMSMMCGDKYCPAWGTAFCEMGKK
jgi:hypothetical protein